MEIPWLARLNTVDLQCSAERDRMHYLAHDRVTGKIYRVSAEIARAVAYCKQIGRMDAARVDKEQLKVAFGFLGSLQNMHKTELSRRPPFNPLFVNIELFDVGPYQPALRPLARFIVGPVYWLLLAALLLVAFWLGSWSDWQIMEVFKNVFSLSAIATFAVVAPFLKILHELGHTLAATRFGVRVRKTGLYLIALYPMPYVDCSDADLSATRKQRIVISLAGLFTDIIVALLAFVAWHFVEGSFLKTLLGNIFMFSSINSVLFNANPLIKLDGYYALADTLGLRNMYTDAARSFRGIRRKITTFGKDGSFPKTRKARWLGLYSLGSVLYKTNMILGIMWVMLPKYFGLGALLALWGGYMMFISPMVSGRAKPAAKDKARSWPFWLLLFSALALALLFIKAPYRVVMPVQADIEGRYSLQVESAGYIRSRAPEGPVRAGDVILQLENADLRDLRALQARQLQTARYAYEAISGADPAGAIVAAERLRAAQTRLDLTDRRIANLTVRAAEDGYFAPDYAQVSGIYVPDGAPAGALFARSDVTRVAGDFPERYVEKFQNTLPQAEMRINGAFLPDTAVQGMDLVQRVSLDSETGVRSYRLALQVAGNPLDLKDADMYVKLSFPKEPLYRHVQFFAAGLIQKYRDAKLRQN